jgi:FtsP/CotA-like multicopper oxidase with cupredoxin domain
LLQNRTYPTPNASPSGRIRHGLIFLRALAMSGIATAFVLTAAWHASLARTGCGRQIRSGSSARFQRAGNVSAQGRRSGGDAHRASELRPPRHGGRPVQNFLVFAYQVARGTASNGEMSGDNLYPAPTLQVFPEETLIVHLDNALTGLTIRDYFNPQYTAKGKEVLLYPEQMTSSPLNLHVHGVHVSPKGNSDNVMLHISPGTANTYK